MKKYIITFAFIYSFVIQCIGQAPGYLGKKFILAVDVLGSSAIKGPTAKNKGSNSNFLFNDGTTAMETAPSIGFNMNYRLSAAYIIANNYALGLNVSLAKTGLRLEDIHNNSFGFYDHFYTLNYSMIGLDITNTKYLAPIGIYWKVGMGLVTGKGKDSELNVLQDPSVNTVAINTNIKPFPYIQLGFGWKNVLFDRVILDFGFEASVVPKPSAYINSYSTSELQENYDRAAKGRIARHMLVNIKAGLGFLIF